MPELTDAQKVNREVTQKRIATALETLAQNSEAPIGLGMTGATVGQVPVVKTVDANGVPTSYEPGAGGGGSGGLPAGGTDGDVLVKNGATDYDATWKKTPPQMGSLATIEPTSTVTQKTQYVQGEYLVYNGQLYKVTASTISQGQTLNPGQGGNIEAVSVGAELNAITKIKIQTFTDKTSDNNANVPLGLSEDNLVLSVCGSGYIYIPFIFGGNWYASVRRTNSSMEPMVKLDNLSGTIVYI